MQYRPEIDGLRALAVLPVLFFHAGFSVFSGGFVGVDVFFVISGYLITSIIFNDLDQGKFSLAHFYERRARRILPALFTVCILCIPVAWHSMLTQEFLAFRESLAATAFFASNFYFWSEAGYFESAAELKPLLHTWSLAVEEQYYILFPLLLLWSLKWPKKLRITFYSTLVIASLVVAECLSRSHPNTSFFLLPSRIWELGFGAITAIFLRNGGITLNNATREAIAISGFLLISFATFTFNDTTPFPGLAALLPVIGTVFIIIATTKRTIIGRLLSLKPMISIGLISYSLYLWHQPLFAFAKIYLPDGIDPPIWLGLFATAFILATLTWQFIERPFRNRQNFSRKQIFGSAAIISIALACIMIPDVKGFTPSASEKMMAWMDELRTDTCVTDYSLPNTETYPENVCIYNAPHPRQTAIWGDSHAIQLAPVLATHLETKDQALLELSNPSCPAILEVKNGLGDRRCAAHNEAIITFLEESNDIQTVILFSRWPIYFEGKNFDATDGVSGAPNRAFMLPIDAQYGLDTPERIPALESKLQKTISRLIAKDKQVILIGPTPESDKRVVEYLARELDSPSKRTEPLSVSLSAVENRTKSVWDAFNALNQHPNLQLIDPIPLFCDTEISGQCLTEQEGTPLYLDDNHLSSAGNQILMEEIKLLVE